MTMNPMDELDRNAEPEQQVFDLDQAVVEAGDDGETAGGGDLHINEEVIQDIASRALSRVSSVKPGSSGASVLGIGRKTPDGVKVSLLEEGDHPQISLDTYVLVRYGLRIPDVAWDLQEFLKKELEKFTGYEVKAVNIFVQGIFFKENEETQGGVSGEETNGVSQNDKTEAAQDTAGE